MLKQVLPERGIDEKNEKTAKVHEDLTRVR
jgi:hypothetical protein